MKTIRIDIQHFGNYSIEVFKKEFRCLDKYNFVLDPINPQVTLFSCRGKIRYDELPPTINNKSVKIFYTKEIISPEITKKTFTRCNYAIGSRRDIKHPRYLYVPPFYPVYSYYGTEFPELQNSPKTKFCNFVYRHSKGRRGEFFKKLIKYKRIDSPGKYLNNMPRIEMGFYNKLKFISSYKFTISFEGSTSLGYCTEKIIDPLLVGTIPIYWGDPGLLDIFNKDALIYVNSFKDFNSAIKYIKYVDNNKEEYNKLVFAPRFTTPPSNWISLERIGNFFDNIFLNI